MQHAALIFAFLATASHGRLLQSTLARSRSSRHDGRQQQTNAEQVGHTKANSQLFVADAATRHAGRVKALSAFLLSAGPVATFNPAGPVSVINAQPESGPFREHAAPSARCGRLICCDGLPQEIQVQVSLEGGGAELVRLATAFCPARVAADLAEKHGLDADQRSALAADLEMQWEDAQADAPDVYVGPFAENNELRNCIASEELTSVGLALEVADSVIAIGGKGLFLRTIGDVESVTLQEGTAICGYAHGDMRVDSHDEGGKTVAFALRSLGQVVWFEKQLHCVGDLLLDESIDEIAGHVAIHDESSGELTGIALDAAWKGPRYFVPSNPQPTLLNISAFGQFANDFGASDAWADSDVDTSTLSEEEMEALYEKASAERNTLGTVFRVERDEQQPRLLVPTRIITTLTRDLTFLNNVPMELGCKYGSLYWKEWATREKNM